MTAAAKPEPKQVVLNGLILRPGDKILITVGPGTSWDEARLLRDGLNRTFPGVDFVIASGVTALAKVEPT